MGWGGTGGNGCEFSSTKPRGEELEPSAGVAIVGNFRRCLVFFFWTRRGFFAPKNQANPTPKRSLDQEKKSIFEIPSF
jgi:hypothetical protein